MKSYAKHNDLEKMESSSGVLKLTFNAFRKQCIFYVSG